MLPACYPLPQVLRNNVLLGSATHVYEHGRSPVRGMSPAGAAACEDRVLFLLFICPEELLARCKILEREVQENSSALEALLEAGRPIILI